MARLCHNRTRKVWSVKRDGSVDAGYDPSDEVYDVWLKRLLE